MELPQLALTTKNAHRVDFALRSVQANRFTLKTGKFKSIKHAFWAALDVVNVLQFAPEDVSQSKEDVG